MTSAEAASATAKAALEALVARLQSDLDAAIVGLRPEHGSPGVSSTNRTACMSAEGEVAVTEDTELVAPLQGESETSSTDQIYGDAQDIRGAEPPQTIVPRAELEVQERLLERLQAFARDLAAETQTRQLIATELLTVRADLVAAEERAVMHEERARVAETTLAESHAEVVRLSAISPQQNAEGESSSLPEVPLSADNAAVRHELMEAQSAAAAFRVQSLNLQAQLAAMLSETETVQRALATSEAACLTAEGNHAELVAVVASIIAMVSPYTIGPDGAASSSGNALAAVRQLVAHTTALKTDVRRGGVCGVRDDAGG